MRKKVLITGGTGFLGKRLALALKDGHDVTLAGRNNIQCFKAGKFTGCPVIPLDIARIEAVRDAVIEVKPDIIIHAAATKFVDLAEKQPLECVDVNVIGSENVARVAMEFGVGVVVGVSTDKAAPPVANTYGLTKALMERILCSLNGKSATKFLCVRFGNIAWSSGSVFPIWKRMQEETGVIGTTGPEMHRFVFSVDEAVRLVLTAIEHADELQGKVLSRTMKAAQMKDFLAVWVKHKGGEWNVIEGRPGERNHEVLVGELELPYSELVEYDGLPHYVITFNERSENPLTYEGMSSADAARLSEEEILEIINNVPSADEL